MAYGKSRTSFWAARNGSLLLLLGWLLVQPCFAQWPTWNGPRRTGEIFEPIDVQAVLDSKPQRRWMQGIGIGYSGPSVFDGRVYVADYVRESGEITNIAGNRDELTGRERLLCYDIETGEMLWEHTYPCKYAISYGGGPRTTPTVDGNAVYFLGAEGDLMSLDRRNGELIWKVSLTERFRCPTPVWGFAATPLIYGESLISLAGGDDSMVVCLNKHTGETQWTALTEEWPGCCSPTIVRAANKDQLMIWGGMERLYSLNPVTGEVYWSQPLAPGWRMSIAPPLQDGDLLFVSGERHVGALYRLNDEQPSAELVWAGKSKTAIYFAMATGLFEGGFIYGCDARKGSLMCARASDGERLWETSRPTTGRERGAEYGSAFLSRVKDYVFILSETGAFIVARLSPEGYEELSRHQIIEADMEYNGRQVVWSYPAYAGRYMVVRNMSSLVCVQLY
jgi:outer membrane protein assembly factor BamB